MSDLDKRGELKDIRTGSSSTTKKKKTGPSQKEKQRREELKTVRESVDDDQSIGDHDQDIVPLESEETYYDKAEWEAHTQSPEYVISQAQKTISEAEAALEEAESYDMSFGSVIEWGGKTYNLGTTEGWRAYRQALRDARSDLADYKRDVKEYRFAVISSEAPEPHKAVSIKEDIPWGGQRLASVSEIAEFEEQGYDIPPDTPIYVDKLSQPMYYPTPPMEFVGPPVSAMDYDPIAPENFVGIPGPASAPPPDSIAAKIQPIVQEAFENTMGLMEASFKAVTVPIRDKAAKLGSKSLEAAMEGDPLSGFGYYAAGTALKVVGAGIDVATFEYRPGLWIDVARTLTGLAVNPMARTALIGEVARDPFGFTAEMAGGAYLGRYAVGKIQSFLGPKKTVTTTPDPMAYRKLQKTSRITTQPPAYKRGAVYKTNTRSMRIGSGFERVQDFIPEEIEVVPGFVSPTGEGSVATPFSKGSYPSAAYSKKLWGQTGAGLRQLSSSEVITIPESMVETQTIWRLIYERRWKPGVETPIYQPKLPKTSIVLGDYMSRTVTSITLTNRPPPSLIGILGLGSQLKTTQPIIPSEIRDRTPVKITRPEQIQRPIQKPVQIPIQIPTQIHIQTPIQTPVQTPIQIQAQIQKSIQALDVPQLTKPKHPPPEKLIPNIPNMPPYQPPEEPKRLPPLRTGQRKKRKKKGEKRPPIGWEIKKYRMPGPRPAGKMKKMPTLKIPKMKKRRRLPKL